VKKPGFQAVAFKCNLYRCVEVMHKNEDEEGHSIDEEEAAEEAAAEEVFGGGGAENNDESDRRDYDNSNSGPVKKIKVIVKKNDGTTATAREVAGKVNGKVTVVAEPAPDDDAFEASAGGAV
jgi:hypothetical protein